MKSHRQAKYVYLFEDEDVKRWYENISRGSRVTADVRLRRLGNFCEAHATTPSKLAALADRKLQNLLMDYVTSAEKKEYAGSYISSTLKALRSWLTYNGREVKVKIKIKGVGDTPSLKDERVPSRDELKRIFLSGDKKARVACSLVAHCGLRIKTLGNYMGEDGLRVKDLPEMKVNGDAIDFEQVPARVIVRKELSKAGHQYFTFLSEEGCEYLKDYLEERLREEKFTSDSPIVTPKQRMKPFIRAVNIGDVIRGAIRGAGFQWRPYVLRCYFDTHLMLAESKGLVLRDYRQFWMGHKGDIENRYTTNKAKLPESVVDDMREAYRRSQSYLQTTKSDETSEEKLRQAFRKELLLVAGFSEEDVQKMDLPTMNDDELQAAIKKMLLGEKIDDCSQKAVPVEDIERYLDEGWEFVATLPNKKVILRLKEA